MIKSNPTLLFGDLLLEVGEYTKVERYFDTVLNSSNLNDEDIACIFFNFGRIHRFKGDLNGLGIVYSELGQQTKAEEYFQQPMKLYKKRASFQIDSCEYNTADELWHIKLHATDQGADLGAEYIEYQKQKMIKSNPTLIFGDLLIEMGEYAKAERYFDTVLNTSNLNDKDIACIFFNFGRIHRLKGDFNRAINCYKRSYDLCMNARLKRFSYAGKAVNGLGIVYSELGQQMKAEEYFQQAMKLYKKSIRKKHVEIAGTLINLGTIDCDRQNFTQALNKYQEAKKIYDSSLPLDHPNRALQRVNEGNIHLATGNYEIALQEYELALKLQEALLPADHANIARTLHNLAIVHASRGNMDEATKYLERAKEIAGQTLSLKHSVMTLLDKPKDFLID
ncbi:unnamed protein product [Rotaria sp. Silwood1]|nr:unnamed protein product [Rotaria sp. Silwood1]